MTLISHAADIDEITELAIRFKAELDATKQRLAPTDFRWYPYDTLLNFYTLRSLLTGENRRLLELIGDDPVVDIGAADGDTAFFLESLGLHAQAVDNASTNANGYKGMRLLREHLDSQVEVHEIDLDSQFSLPSERYGLAFFLGILYHLKNPFYALERLGRHARHALISTRVTRYNVATDRLGSPGQVNDTRVDLSRMPLAYLVAPDECNNDATNFWMFTDAGLRRILDRTGWDILDYMVGGDTEHSDPATLEHDERAFCLVRSRSFDQ